MKRGQLRLVPLKVLNPALEGELAPFRLLYQTCMVQPKCIAEVTQKKKKFNHVSIALFCRKKCDKRGVAGTFF
jgi:hypothetical protein